MENRFFGATSFKTNSGKLFLFKTSAKLKSTSSMSFSRALSPNSICFALRRFRIRLLKDTSLYVDRGGRGSRMWFKSDMESKDVGRDLS